MDGFYPLSDNFDPEAFAEIDDGFDDGSIFRIGVDVANEGTIDLQDVHGELLQVRQGSIACSEIIEGNLHARSAERSQRLGDIFSAAAKENRLGDLKLHGSSRKSLPIEPFQQPFSEIAGTKLCRRCVHGHVPEAYAFIAPGLDVPDHPVDHPVADPGREIEVLKGGFHRLRQLYSARWVLPPEESLETFDPACPEADLGLVERNDQLLVERLLGQVQHG